MIDIKRSKLVRFIHEQVLGPGISGYRFVDVSDPHFSLYKIGELEPLDYRNEIINNAPGASYSTGILFPFDKSQTAVIEPDLGEDDDGSKENIEPDIEDETTLNINQMYPNTMGLTCAFEKDVIDPGDLKVMIYARYYTRLEKSELQTCGVFLEGPIEPLNKFLLRFSDDHPLRKKLSISKVGSNIILGLQSLRTEEFKEIKTKLREIEKAVAKDLGSDRDHQALSGYKEFLYRELMNKAIDQNDRLDLLRKIGDIEIVESIISHINDLLNIYGGQGYGLWKSNWREQEIVMPEPLKAAVHGKRVYAYKRYETLNGIFGFQIARDEVAALALNIQVSKDSRQGNSHTFVKLQLVNVSTEFETSEGDSRYYSVFNETVNQRCFFGVKIRVYSKYLVPYREVLPANKDRFNEDDVNRFLYRQYRDFAIGHGCSVKWDALSEIKMVETEYVPSFDTPDVDSVPRDKADVRKIDLKYEPARMLEDTKCLQFKWLSTLSDSLDDEIIAQLNKFIKAYSSWIQKKRTSYTTETGPSQRMIDQELSKCEQDRDRMSRNIAQLLSGDDNASNMRSFRLMNTAMFIQLWHSVKVKKREVQGLMDAQGFAGFDESFYRSAADDLFKEGDPSAWRPFQMAFILLNLDGIFQLKEDRKWSFRNDWVDLVWFPTGGGKTEAYLGLIALTIIHRRRTKGDIGGGTAVIMRYTLRLLTLQQFQRATLLIMALELMRRWGMYELGSAPIYIGLWVGGDSLPNFLKKNPSLPNKSLEEVYENIRDAQNAHKPNISSKIPFTHCPWCGHELNPISYELITDRSKVHYYNRILLNCSTPQYKCSFGNPLRLQNRRKDHGAIPVSLCDEEIYQHPPALLFGTVDKFAQLAHKVSPKDESRHKDSRRLFGGGNWEQGKPPSGYLTPDLIIQDELHLLLGPLGSAVALFESAVDQLCTRAENSIKLRPKIISSTATTRNTDLQIMALFDRKVNLFPKPGVECDDSFFAFYKRVADSLHETAHYISKRKYLGILPTGRTQIWMQMRLAAILLTHRAIFELEQLGNNSAASDASYSEDLIMAMDYYHTVLSYFNSLREVGKTESQIHTYILKEIRRVFNRVVRPGKLMHGLYTYSIIGSELTGRLSGEEVKRELDLVSSKWHPLMRFAHQDEHSITRSGTTPPDFVVATNMISVGIDIARFNLMIINSMPRNVAEYIQASSRVARESFGLVLTVHHPFRARDVSHYEKFIEFHEKMYSYVEPISITPFTKKAVQRYLGLYVATMIRHKTNFADRRSASGILTLDQRSIHMLNDLISHYFQTREQSLSQADVNELIKNLLTSRNVREIEDWIRRSVDQWRLLGENVAQEGKALVFSYKAQNSNPPQEQLYVDIDEYEGNIHSKEWQIPQSLRVVEPEAVIRIKSK